jgi:hypothetical protein
MLYAISTHMKQVSKETEEEDVFFAIHLDAPNSTFTIPTSNIAYTFSMDKICQELETHSQGHRMPLAIHQLWLTAPQKAEELTRHLFGQYNNNDSSILDAR